jgi:glycosyl transferase family 1
VSAPLRIVVTGLAATYPLGGVFWDYLQYPVGLRRLGHEVLYLEDTGKWCYDPETSTFVESGRRNAERLAAALGALSVEQSRCWFFRDGPGETYGLDWADVVRFCRSADLFLHVSASCWMREEYFAARRVAFIDSDPMYTQASVPDYLSGTIAPDARARVDMLRRHDVFFTFGERVGAPDCRIPTGLFDWIPTRQPILLDCFAAAAVPIASRRRTLTTVASWEPTERGPVIQGVTYAGKSVEFERVIELPARSVVPLELALSGPAPAERLRAHGWRVVDGQRISRDPWVYRAYLGSSSGEFSVAKHAYAVGRSGWFSCRTACYLALGVPAVVQATGFEEVIPTGEGVFAFETADEAAAGIERLVSDPERHAKAARALADEYFDSSKVLPRLLAAALG